MSSSVTTMRDVAFDLKPIFGAELLLKPGALRVAEEHAGSDALGICDQVIAQAWQLAVGGPLLALIDSRGRRRKHLGDEARRALVGRMIVGRIAHEHCVGVVKGRAFVEPQFHVGHEGAATTATGGGSQVEGDVQRDAIVPLARALHRMRAPADEFVLDRRAFLQTQVFVLDQRLQRLSARHGGIGKHRERVRSIMPRADY